MGKPFDAVPVYMVAASLSVAVLAKFYPGEARRISFQAVDLVLQKIEQGPKGIRVVAFFIELVIISAPSPK